MGTICTVDAFIALGSRYGVGDDATVPGSGTAQLNQEVNRYG